MGNGHPEVRAEPAHVPLPSWLAADLAVCLTRHPRQTDSPLFPGRRRYPYNPATGPLDWSVSWDRDPFLKNQFRPALNEAGLPSSVRQHDLRHAFASICAARVIPLSRVPRYLGHSSIAITDALDMPLFATDADADRARLPGRRLWPHPAPWCRSEPRTGSPRRCRPHPG